MCLAIHTFDLTETIKQLSVPVKLIYGLNDQVCQLEDGIEFKQAFKNVQMIKVQSFEAGHQLIKDKHEEVVKLILGFLDDPMDVIKK